MGVNWKAFTEQISHYESFVLVSHIRPDCDALGSELGMAEVLRSVGKKVRIINAHRTPPALQFLDPAGNIEVLGDDVEAEDISADCIMVLDTSAWAQLGDMGDVIRASRADKMVLDHHVGEDDLGATMYKDYQAEATGHLVVQAADALKVPLTRSMAVPLFAAIATDTGWFRFGSVTAETYRVIARLIDAGVVPSEIYGDLYERDTLGRLRLRGLILSRTKCGTGWSLDAHLCAERRLRGDRCRAERYRGCDQLDPGGRGNSGSGDLCRPASRRIQVEFPQSLWHGLQRDRPPIRWRRTQGGRGGVPGRHASKRSRSECCRSSARR